MTQEEFVNRAWCAICSVLNEQNLMPLEVTVEQAWNAFLCYLARHPFSSVAQHYATFGTFYIAHFAELWLCYE